MPLHAIELLLTPEDDARIRALWAALQAAGLPSQARHGGATNAPHLTVAAAPGIDPCVERQAADGIGPLLPASLDVSGVELLGRGPFAVVVMVSPSIDLGEAVAGVRRALRDDGPWVPHVTLARRVHEAEVSAVMEVLATLELPDRLVASTLRRWDPDHRTVRDLVPSEVPATPLTEREDSCADASR